MKNKLILLSFVTLASGCLPMEQAKLVGGPASLSQANTVMMPISCVENLDIAASKKDESIVKIRLKNEVVEKVLEELKGKSDIRNFWNNISPALSQELLLNLGLSLGPELIQTSRAPLQAVAFVFEEIQRTGIKDMAYRIKTKSGITYSYEIAGEALEAVSRLSSKCSEEIFDVSRIDLPKTAQKLNEIVETYRCKVEATTVDLIRLKETSFIMTKTENIEISNKEIKEKENNRKIVLSIDTKEVQLTLKFKKKRDRELDDVGGKKTKIDIRTADTDIKGTGVCEFETDK